MRKILFSILFIALILGGCHRHTPENEAILEDEPAIVIDNDPLLYAQGVNVTVGGLVYRVNSAEVYEDLAGIPFAIGFEDHIPSGVIHEDKAYLLLVSQTFINPFDISYEFTIGYSSPGKFTGSSFSEYGNNRLLTFDRNSKKFNGFRCTIDPYEELTVDMVYVFNESELSQNIYLGLKDQFASLDREITWSSYIELHTVNAFEHPMTPINVDMPPPINPPIFGNEDIPPDFADPNPPFRPNQFVEIGEAVIHNDTRLNTSFSYTLSSVELIENFQGYDWCPYELYLEEANRAARFKGEPGYRPEAYLVKLMVANLTDDAISDAFFEPMLFSLDENGRIFGGATVLGIEGANPYDPYMLYRNVAPNEEFTLTLLYVYSIDDPDYTADRIPPISCLTPVSFGIVSISDATVFRFDIVR